MTKFNKKFKAVLFSAEWDFSSHYTVPMFEKTCIANKIKYSVIDVDTRKGADMSVKYLVKNVPTLLVLGDEGKEVARFKGRMCFQELEKWVTQ